MAASDTQFHGLGTEPAPSDWEIPSSLTFLLKAARAVYDGSGAAVAFLPALEIISDSGLPVGTYVATTPVSAGATADVSFAPFLRSPSGGSAPSTGIQFDVDNTGTWFEMHTSGANPADPAVGIHLESDGTSGGFRIISGHQGIEMHSSTDGFFGGNLLIQNHGNNFTLLQSGSSSMFIDSDTAASIRIGSDNAAGTVNICGNPGTIGNELSFFDSGGAVQQTLPAAPTGAQIRALLVAYGLCAP